MSTKPLEIVLSTDQLERLNALAAVEGVAIADIVRRALDIYVESHRQLALATTFGSDPKLAPPGRGTDEWLNDIRALPPLDIDERATQDAVSESKDDFGNHG